jgi:hypothetical protein
MMGTISRVFGGFRAFVEQVFRWRRQNRLPLIAVFIDADNVHEPGIRYVFEKLTDEWNATYRRAYGRGLMNRADIFRKYGILPIDVVSNTPGKNAADMALIIDAMTELHTNRVDAFCLVTGDGDFTRLAIAFRERGLPVLGFGAASTPASLRSACTEFHVFQSPADARAKVTTVVGGKRKAKGPIPVKDRREFSQLVRRLTQGTGTATFRRINQEACRRDANFSSRQYGATSLKRLMADLAEFDVCPVTNKSGAITDYEVVVSPEAKTTVTI